MTDIVRVIDNKVMEELEEIQRVNRHYGPPSLRQSAITPHTSAIEEVDRTWPLAAEDTTATLGQADSALP